MKTPGPSEEGTGAEVQPGSCPQGTEPHGHNAVARPLTVDPEAALVGALLHRSADDASNVLDLITADDIADPHLTVIADAAQQLADRGIAPDPTAVLAHVRATGTVTGAHAVNDLALLLAGLYAACANPASARWYAVAVLEEALRRRVRELADRVTQAADSAPLDTVTHVLERERQAVRDLDDRRTAAAGGTPTRLRAAIA
jgi:replicative DNA helicase